ncbi:MAG TPA: hypothetical protein VKB63_05430, partial [Gemmatimonadales bacterium]|nr:hypothetical protein [Gemmatimonadales bacterium]
MVVPKKSLGVPMMHSRLFSLTLTAAAGVMLVSCSADNTGPQNASSAPRMASTADASSATYVVNGTNNTLPANFAASVADAGGTLEASNPEIGVAYVTSSDQDFKSKALQIAGVAGVGKDQLVQWVSPNEQAFDAGDVTEDALGGGDETFFNLQWNYGAVHADQALT